MNQLNDVIRLTIGQAVYNAEEMNYQSRFRYKHPEKQLQTLYRFVSTAVRGKADFLVLPEFFLPRQFLFKHIKPICERTGIIMIGGMEYGPGYLDDSSHEPLNNEAFIAIPYELQTYRKNEHIEYKYRQSSLICVPKIEPAPDEDRVLQENGYSFSGGNKLYIFDSSSLGAWAILICFDFLNLSLQTLLQGKIQNLFVLTFNKDIEGFAGMADTIQRLLMCNVLVCNTGLYGGSLAYSPHRHRISRYKYRVQGNNVGVAVTIELPLKKLAEFQRTGKQPEQKGDKFIERPPYYEYIESHCSREIVK